jgi:hypothetical protein
MGASTRVLTSLGTEPVVLGLGFHVLFIGLAFPKASIQGNVPIRWLFYHPRNIPIESLTVVNHGLKCLDLVLVTQLMSGYV